LPTCRTAISIPADVLEDIDRVARLNGESRSGFITRILRLALQARRDQEVTRRLNQLFADEVLQSEQQRGIEQLDSTDSDWHEEGW
jgi:metal-responsive CopG/Arc/MetJ family transcriptional regulator